MFYYEHKISPIVALQISFFPDRGRREDSGRNVEIQSKSWCHAVSTARILPSPCNAYQSIHSGSIICAHDYAGQLCETWAQLGARALDKEIFFSLCTTP